MNTTHFDKTLAARPTWRPQVRDDPEAWASLIFQPALAERFAGYHTYADALFGEIIHYAVLRDESSIGDLLCLYQRILSEGMPVDIRRQIYQETASAQQREPVVVSCNAYLPFIFCETAGGIVGSATIDFVSLAELIDGDPMTRVKEMIGFIERKNVENRGAVFGALLFIGDGRVSRLLVPARDSLTASEVSSAMRSITGLLSAASIEFLINWLEGLDENSDAGLFGTVASGLVNARRLATSAHVMTGLRPFPVTSVMPDERLRMARMITIDEFITRVAPRLLALERAETEPKIMPVVLEAWGIPPLAEGPLGRSKVARVH